MIETTSAASQATLDAISAKIVNVVTTFIFSSATAVIPTNKQKRQHITIFWLTQENIKNQLILSGLQIVNANQSQLSSKHTQIVRFIKSL